MARRPPDVLITTPESLFLVLTSRARAFLESVDTVIVDEIHSLVATKRARLVLGLGVKKDPHMIDVPLLGRVAAGAPLVARWHKKFARRLRDPVISPGGEVARGHRAREQKPLHEVAAERC